MSKTIFILTIHDNLITPEPFFSGFMKQISHLIDSAISCLEHKIEYQIEFVHISNFERIFEYDKKNVPFDLVIDYKQLSNYSYIELEGVFSDLDDQGAADAANSFNNHIDRIKGLRNMIVFAKSLGGYKSFLEELNKSKWVGFFKLNVAEK